MKRNRVITQLFNKEGDLNGTEQFELCGYTWTISTTFAEVHSVPAIDFMLECNGLEEGKYLSMAIIFMRLHRGSSKRVEHVFDKQRNTYCFRRMVTGTRHLTCDGGIFCSFPNDRFMLCKETNEKYDSPRPRPWIYHNLVSWSLLADGRIEADSTKPLSDRFHYGIELKHLGTFDDSPPPRQFPVWPKSNECLMNFFQPVWPKVASVIFDFVFDKPKTFPVEQMLDIFGAYYHKWSFDEAYLLELNSLAIKYGFNSFMDGIKFGGDFQNAVSFEKSANVVKHWPQLEIRKRNTMKRYERTWNVERIPKFSETPSVFKMFISSSLQWNVSFFTSTFRDQKYLSVGALLAGDVKGSHSCCMCVEYQSKDIEGRSIKQLARRILCQTQNTICIPMLCSEEDIDKGGDPAGHTFKVTFYMKRAENREVEEVLPGPTDVTLKIGDDRIEVNKTFLAHHVQYFSALLFNKSFNQHDKEEVEVNYVSYEEMLHFLDALYHGTKVFDISQYYPVLRVADQWICDSVIRIVEKAIKNTSCRSVNKEKLAKKFNLDMTPQLIIPRKKKKMKKQKPPRTEPLPKKPRKEHGSSY